MLLLHAFHYLESWMITSCCGAVAIDFDCKFDFFFLNFNSRFIIIDHWIVQPSNTCNLMFISSVVHRITMLYCRTAALRFAIFFVQFAERVGLQSTSRPCVVIHAVYQSIFSHSPTELSDFWMPLADKNRIPRTKFSFFKTSHLSRSLVLRLLKVHAYSHLIGIWVRCKRWISVSSGSSLRM